jgi:hypothetical protein
MTTQNAPKSTGSALFGITLVIFLRDAPDVTYSLSISLFLVRCMNGVPLRLDPVQHPALRPD